MILYDYYINKYNKLFLTELKSTNNSIKRVTVKQE